MERACAAIWAIARIVGNCANEPEASGGKPLDAWIMSNLIGGIVTVAQQPVHTFDAMPDCLTGEQAACQSTERQPPRCHRTSYPAYEGAEPLQM
ncbi:hypothetical protein G6F68_016756 [Rhizopus microsporus]|nr:hypothetical protein G6F68_016756 [Rhizopus microsporus]